MIISATCIKKSKTRRVCESCLAVLRGPHIRFYGAAERGDPPYVIYLCCECVGTGENERETAKIDKAVDEARADNRRSE